MAALERMKERAARDAFTSDSSYFASDVNFDTLPYWERGGEGREGKEREDKREEKKRRR